MKVISFLLQKGGVGKSTTTISVGAGLAKLNKKACLIDFDPQGSLSCSLGIESPEYSITDALKGEVSPQKTIIKKGKLSVIPASIDLAEFENKNKNSPGKELVLKKVISELKGFDYILVDCPPSLNLLTISALAASTEIYIPVQTEFLALQGLGQLFDTLNAVKQRINKNLKIGGIIGTRFNRRKINKDVMNYLNENFGEMVCKTVIHENVSLAEAPSFGLDIFTHAPDSIGAKDYLALSKEILQRTK